MKRATSEEKGGQPGTEQEPERQTRAELEALMTPEGREKLEAMARNMCPKCGSPNVVCRPVLDETFASRHGHDYEATPDLWCHWHCCDACRLIWPARLSLGDDLGVMDSERNLEHLLNLLMAGHYDMLK